MAQQVKNLLANAGDTGDAGSIPGQGIEIPYASRQPKHTHKKSSEIIL